MNENSNDMGLELEFLSADDFADTEPLDGSQTEAETETGETTATEQENEQTETPDPAPAQEEEAENTPPQEHQDSELPEKITIKHLKGDYDVPRDKIKDTLERGMDYERVRTQRDAAVQQLNEQSQWRQQHEGTISMLEAMAQKSGKNLETVVRELRVNLYRGNGATQAEALARVAQEDAEAKLAAMQKQTQAAQQQQTEQQSRAQKDFLEFNRRYPDVKLQNVPQSVIQRAATGEMSLSSAYAEHLLNELKAENQRLQQSLAAKQQNESNRQKTTGSVKTEGSKTEDDPWLVGFDSN